MHAPSAQSPVARAPHASACPVSSLREARGCCMALVGLGSACTCVAAPRAVRECAWSTLYTHRAMCRGKSKTHCSETCEMLACCGVAYLWCSASRVQARGLSKQAKATKPASESGRLTRSQRRYAYGPWQACDGHGASGVRRPSTVRYCTMHNAFVRIACVVRRFVRCRLYVRIGMAVTGCCLLRRFFSFCPPSYM